MLLTNFYGGLMLSETSLANGVVREFDADSYDKSIKIRNKSNTPLTQVSTDIEWGNWQYGSIPASSVVVGEGTTEPELSDINLELPIDKSKYNVIKTSPVIIYDGSNGQFYINNTYVVTCMDPNGISVNEWGFYSMSGNYLYYREVFDETFELALGDTLTLDIRATLNTPLAD